MLHFIKYASTYFIFLFPLIFRSRPSLPNKTMLGEDVSQLMHVGIGQPQQLGALRLPTCCDIAAEGLSPTPGNTATT